MQVWLNDNMAGIARNGQNNVSTLVSSRRPMVIHRTCKAEVLGRAHFSCNVISGVSSIMSALIRWTFSPLKKNVSCASTSHIWLEVISCL